MDKKKSSRAIERAATKSRAAMLKATSTVRRGKAEGSGVPTLEAGEDYCFVAYARADETVAEQLVGALRAHGIKVQWDGDLIGGDNFRRRLDTLLEGGRAVIVVWSANVTDYVIDEAGLAKDRGTLITCRVAGLSPREIPTGFRGFHCIDVDDIEAILKALAGRGLAVRKAD